MSLSSNTINPKPYTDSVKVSFFILAILFIACTPEAETDFTSDTSPLTRIETPPSNAPGTKVVLPNPTETPEQGGCWWKGEAIVLVEDAEGRRYSLGQAELPIRTANRCVFAPERRSFDPYILPSPIDSRDRTHISALDECGREITKFSISPVEEDSNLPIERWYLVHDKNSTSISSRPPTWESLAPPGVCHKRSVPCFCKESVADTGVDIGTHAHTPTDIRGNTFCSFHANANTRSYPPANTGAATPFRDLHEGSIDPARDVGVL